MPRRDSQEPRKKPKAKLTTVQLDAPSSTKKLKPLAFSRPPVFDVAGGGASAQGERPTPGGAKGKGRASAVAHGGPRAQGAPDDRLWVDIFEPSTEAQLAVHKRKVEDVRRWFVDAFGGGPSGKLRKYRRILALTGPAGTAKTTTVRVLARELGFDILEWKNTIGERFSRDDFDDSAPAEHEDLFQKFQAFLTRASTCQSIFSADNSASRATQSSQPALSSQSHSQNQTASIRHARQQIILLEDLPNILHPKTQDSFHSALQALVDSPSVSVAPIVIIVSDSGLRGEATEEKMSQGGARGKDVVDIRSVLPPALLSSPYVTQIGFNPIAPTLLRRALQSLVASRFSSDDSTLPPSKESLDVIVESANGDIRSAVMALQFACVVGLPDKKGRQKSGAGKGARVILEAITRREQSLALFHLLGKVMYNKRKGDPTSHSASAKDIMREKELDGRLKEPPGLPAFLQEHERKASRVDVDTLYADSPIDSSLFSLYIHQNYTQFCDEMEHCDGIAEWLSWVDSSGGDAWYQANPHRFHLLTLGTLHALPSPVARRSQKFFKPEFFDALSRERDAWDGVGDVRRWLAAGQADGPRARGWGRAAVAAELGGVLRARDAAGVRPAAPASHRAFSRLVFAYRREGGAGGQPLGEGDAAEDAGDVDADADEGGGAGGGDEEKAGGGWLEGDDIEEF